MKQSINQLGYNGVSRHHKGLSITNKHRKNPILQIYLHNKCYIYEVNHRMYFTSGVVGGGAGRAAALVILFSERNHFKHAKICF